MKQVWHKNKIEYIFSLIEYKIKFVTFLNSTSLKTKTYVLISLNILSAISHRITCQCLVAIFASHWKILISIYAYDSYSWSRMKYFIESAMIIKQTSDHDDLSKSNWHHEK